MESLDHNKKSDVYKFNCESWHKVYIGQIGSLFSLLCRKKAFHSRKNTITFLQRKNFISQSLK